MGSAVDEIRGQLKYIGIKESEFDGFESFIMEVDKNISVEDIILSEGNKKKIEQFKLEQENKEKLIAYKLYPINRLLLYGASGTGKTMLAKALSNYFNYTLLYIDIAQSLEQDTVAKNISNIFKLANTIGSCIIFLDECDAIAWSRDSAASDSINRRIATNSLFQQLDQMNKTNIFISATNMIYRIDYAFERRFNMKMEFTRPKNKLDDSIKRFMREDFELVDDIQNNVKHLIERRIKESVKMSYYTIEVITEKAMKRAIMENTNKVKLSWIFGDLADEEKMNIEIIPIENRV